MLPAIRMVHVLDIPEHAPDQPTNFERLSVLRAIRVTVVPCVNVDPDGFRVTLPLPEPLLATVRA